MRMWLPGTQPAMQQQPQVLGMVYTIIMLCLRLFVLLIVIIIQLATVQFSTQQVLYMEFTIMVFRLILLISKTIR